MDEIQKHFEKEGTLPYEPLKEAVKQLAHSDEDLEKVRQITCNCEFSSLS